MPQSRIGLNLWFSDIIKDPHSFHLSALPSWTCLLCPLASSHHGCKLGTTVPGIISRQDDIQQRVVVSAFLCFFKSLEIFLRSLPWFPLNLSVQNLIMDPPLNQSLAMGMWSYKQILYNTGWNKYNKARSSRVEIHTGKVIGAGDF